MASRSAAPCKLCKTKQQGDMIGSPLVSKEKSLQLTFCIFKNRPPKSYLGSSHPQSSTQRLFRLSKVPARAGSSFTQSSKCGLSAYGSTSFKILSGISVDDEDCSVHPTGRYEIVTYPILSGYSP